MSSLKNIKAIKKEFRGLGFVEEDIKIATDLMKWIGAIDKKVFPNNPAEFIFGTKKHKWDFFAAFIDPEKNSNKRQYKIYTRGLADLLKDEKKAKKALLKRKHSGYKSILISHTWQELFLGIAVHEVRHRIQHDLKIKMFSAKDIDRSDTSLLGNILCLNKLIFETKKEIHIEEKRSKRYIQNRQKQVEFDASFIQKLVIQKIHGKNVYSLSDQIVKIIKIQAPSKNLGKSKNRTT